MLRTVLPLAALLLVACSSSSPQPEPTPTPTEPTPTEPTPTEPTEPTPTEPAPAELPAQGEKCPDGACAEGLECVKYFGIAGANGPEFTSCEIRCADDPSVCPDGQSCVAIADGPGQVCRAQ